MFIFATRFGNVSNIPVSHKTQIAEFTYRDEKQ